MHMQNRSFPQRTSLNRRKKAKYTILCPVGVALSRAWFVHSCATDRKEIILLWYRIDLLLTHYEKDLIQKTVSPLQKKSLFSPEQGGAGGGIFHAFY